MSTTPEIYEFQAFLAAQQEQDGLQWRKADLLATIRRKYGEKALRLVSREHRLQVAYLVRISRVATDIVEDDRDIKLTFSHHMIAWQAGDWRRWIKLAADNDWSVGELKQAIADEKGTDPNSAARMASHASRSMRKAADDAVGTPAMEEVVHHARSAYEYTRARNGDEPLNPFLHDHTKKEANGNEE